MSEIKTLLVNTPPRTDILIHIFPIGLGYTTAILKQNNYPADVLECFEDDKLC